MGCVAVERYGRVGLLRSLAVRDEWRGRGLGQELVHAIEQHALAHNIGQLYLLTETAADFFTELGYTRIAREEADAGVRGSAEFRTLCPNSAVCMTKTL